MRQAETVTFGGGGLNRAEDLRRHPDQLAALPVRTLLLWRGKPLLDRSRGALQLLDGSAFDAFDPPVFVGEVEGAAIWARDVSALEVEGADDTLGAFLDPSEQSHPDLPPGSAFVELRATMTQMSALDAEIAATAKGALEWHRTHRFCSNCGAETTPGKAGWMRACGSCGRSHFPRTDPVVIMLITRGDRVLLGRSHGWPEGFFSCLAGFMEPGETMEGAVRREVWEETGVRVGPVRYLASQPWPFPGSLMLGAHGEAITEEITVDEEEIAEAIWLDRSEVLSVFAGTHPTVTPARKGAIARFLLEAWLADRLT
ncbi:NADH pyrophosphatase [Jannaschia pagri]|uniref:NAD(+) diphosphatase n=1 Tax=Jannaschia pagri TaxID=2829797 RepID=A0ABQ4NI79_9RHOB|nr:MULTISPECIES: NAD(+) diphosphatase [unclassified Jannaschia]GIT89761.1 NADH pyrophosphatase [Jannaschia sp. AI_61]GIT94131.1 NADH pyrophosphatase [Jannaschia sp. AI_62]